MQSARKLVVWLENQKVREYKIEDRKALADTQSDSWDAAFSKYLQDLECPVPASDLTTALCWLVAFALNLDYEDNADKLAASLPALSRPEAAASGAAKQSSTRDDDVFSDLQDPRVAAAVAQLVHAVQASTASNGSVAPPPSSASTPSPLVEQLMAAAQSCVCELGPALRPGVWNPGRPPSQALAGVPLGFEVEGEALSAAATALRLLYIRDLRRLQSQIDHAVVEMQEYTANPKTDSSLGKVGR